LHPSTERFLQDNDAQINFKTARSIDSYAPSASRSTSAQHLREESKDGRCHHPEGKNGPESEELLSSFSALYLCGGHGCVEDFDNAALRLCVEHMFSVRRGCVGAICHGPVY
jgi:putative intracellular protease/amidase